MDTDLSFLSVLEQGAARTPDESLAVYGDRTVTYQGMVDWAATLAAGLQARGMGAGDVVGLLSYNCTEFLATIFAANHLGAIAMPVNWRLAAPEFRFIPRALQARARVRRRSRRPRGRGHRPRSPGLVRLRVGDGHAPGWESFDALVGEHAPVPRARLGRRRGAPAHVHVGRRPVARRA